MSEVELLPCPFCGGEATTFQKKFIDGRKFGIMCKETFCCIIPANFNKKEDAIKAWNTRKQMDDIVDRLEEASFWTASTFDEDGYCNDDSQEAVYLDDAIEIVKEVINK